MLGAAGVKVIKEHIHDPAEVNYVGRSSLVTFSDQRVIGLCHKKNIVLRKIIKTSSLKSLYCA